MSETSKATCKYWAARTESWGGGVLSRSRVSYVLLAKRGLAFFCEEGVGREGAGAVDVRAKESGVTVMYRSDTLISDKTCYLLKSKIIQAESVQCLSLGGGFTPPSRRGCPQSSVGPSTIQPQLRIAKS